MSSAVNKFSLFGDEEEKQQQQPPGPSKQKDPQQQGNGQPASQGPQRQGGQQTQGGGRGGQGAGRAGSQPQGVGREVLYSKELGEEVLHNREQAGEDCNKEQVGMDLLSRVLGRVYLNNKALSGPGSHPGGAVGSRPPSAEHQVKGGPGAEVKSLCPVCKNTELNLKSKDLPNHNTCTQCKSVVCNMCGFSPPDATVSEIPNSFSFICISVILKAVSYNMYASFYVFF